MNRRDLLQFAVSGATVLANGGRSMAMDTPVGADPARTDKTPERSGTSELHRLDAYQAAAMIRSGELSPVALTVAMLDRIAKIDPDYESYAYVTTALAMEQAQRAEQEIRRGINRGPLHGVPVAVKDLCDTVGIPSAAGFSFLKDRRPQENATVVDRLAASGAVLLGKLRTTEGAFSVHHDGKSAPRNPWRGDHWAGHSSSGSGVATALGLAFAAIGTDTGGSIRYPASANGVVGIKPSWGRVSRHGVFPMAPSLDHVGALGRSVTDVALMLEIIAGRDERDATSSPRPVPSYRDGLAAKPAGLRIAIDRRLVNDGVDDEVRQTLQRVEQVFRQAGATIVEVALPYSEAAVAAWSVVSGAEAAIAHRTLFAAHADAYSPQLSAFLRRGATVDAAALSQAALTRLAVSDELDALLLTSDAILLPVQCWAPPSLADMVRRGSDAAFVAGLLRFTAPSDLTGHPALVLPGGVGSGGVPIGFQLIGRKFDEATLLNAGHAYETAVERARPPGF